MNHLRITHKIDSTEILRHASKRLNGLFDPSYVPAHTADRKTLLARRTTLWLCRDLLPFSLVQGNGFFDWMNSNGYIKNKIELPNERTLANSALNDLCVLTEKNFQTSLQMTPSTITIQIDFWTSQAGCTPYVTLAIQFLDEKWNMKTLSLTTEKFARPHSALRCANVLIDCLTRHGLGEKKLIGSGDHGSNIVNLPQNVPNCVSYIDCIGHSIHLIFSSDLPKDDSWKPFAQVMSKVKRMHGALCYQLYSLKDHFDQVQHKKVTDYLAELELNIEAFIDDETFEPYEQTQREQILVEAYQDITMGIEKSSAFKKPNATRWFSSQEMLNSYFKNSGETLFLTTVLNFVYVF